jgi:hypothetical protein
MTEYVKAADLFIPKHLAKTSHKPLAIVFWFSRKVNRILVGLPEEHPVPPILRNLGFEKIVCRSAREVDKWSQKMRDQERRDEEMTDEQREAFEGPLRAELRKDLVWRMENSRNAINREFCRQALANMDAEEQKQKAKRESMMHVEGYEAGH